MSGKIKIGGLVFAAALILLFAGLSFGQDPCGGTYQGEGLKAQFWPYYADLDPQNPVEPFIGFSGKILNDVELWPYQYQVPGGDCVFLFQRGHVVVDINRPEKTDGTDEDRYVQMNLALAPNSAYCENTPVTLRMAHIHTVAFHFLTEKEFIAKRENGKLILSCKKYGWNYLNFATMTPGHTYYTQMSFTFKVFGDPTEYAIHTQAKVFYGNLVNSTGGPGWEVTPIHEPYVVRVITTKGKTIVKIEDTPHYPSVYQGIGFPESDCPEGEPWKSGPDWLPGQGIYHFPFKLILERLR